MAYLPNPRTVSVDMTKFSGKMKARWYDPTNGVFSTIVGSPFLNVGTQTFTPPATNASGDGDFVLVLEKR